MTIMQMTRPAKPGDVLWASFGDGWRAEIALAEPLAHPPTGPADIPPVRVEATLWLEAEEPGGTLRRDLLDPDRPLVMNQELRDHWGFWQRPQPGDDKGWRHFSTHRDGDAIAPLITEMAAYVREQVRIVEAARDTHAASVARLESARAAAYAAWPVSIYDGDDVEDAD